MATLLVVTLAAAPGILLLELRTDGSALAPLNDTVVQIDQEIREHFSLRDYGIVIIETSNKDGIYNTQTLRRIKELSRALSELNGISSANIMSLASERRDRVYPGTLDFRPFLDPFPDTPELLDQLRSDVEAMQILTGTLVSEDATAAAIIIDVPPSISPAQAHGDTCVHFDRTAFYYQVLETVEPFESDSERILVVGAPFAEALLGSHIIEDLIILVPFSILVIASVLWMGCRRLWGVMLGLFEVLACLVWTFGLMGWLGVPVYLTTTVLPVILTSIGLADEVHIFWCYQRLLTRNISGTNQQMLVTNTMEEMTRPVVLTSLTTTIAFLSFLASPIEPVRVFGVFAGAGIMFCLFWSLIVTPAFLTILHPQRMRHPLAGNGKELSLPESNMSFQCLFRQRRPTMVTLLLLTLCLSLGVPRLVLQDSWIDGFAPRSEFRLDLDRANSILHGVHVLLAHLTVVPSKSRNLSTTRGPGPLSDPAILNEIGEFEAFVRARPEVGGVLGPHSHITTINFLLNARRHGTRTIPNHPNKVMRVFDAFDRIRGIHRRRQIVDDNLSRAVVTIFIKVANYRETEALMAAINDYQTTHLAPLGIRINFAGDVAISQAMISSVVHSQVVSLLVAFGGAFLVSSMSYRSFIVGLLAVSPASIGALWVFGAMGWLNIPIGVATSMFCAITLGIGVDYGIHFLDRYLRARASKLQDPLPMTLAEAGPAIITDALAIALGFSVLLFSKVPANTRLGMLVAMALFSSCVVTLVGLGVVLSHIKRWSI